MRALALFLVALLFGAVLVIPTSAAQSTPASVTVFTEFDEALGDNRLRPETEELVGSVWAQITIQVLTVCVEPIPVMFEVKMLPGYATVFIHDPVQYFQIHPGLAPTQYTVKTLVTISTTRDAPAYADALYGFAVHVVPPSMLAGCNVAPSTGYGTMTVKNDYVPGIRVQEATVEHEGMTGWIDVPIENHANGPTRVRAILEPESPDEFALINANDIVLESRTINGAEAAWSGVMRIYYALEHVETASLKVRFLAAHDQSQSDVETVEAMYSAVGTLPEGGEATESRPIEPLHGDPASLPGPSIPMLMLLGAALVAWVRRRRQ